jgi:hypothetical protein
LEDHVGLERAETTVSRRTAADLSLPDPECAFASGIGWLRRRGPHRARLVRRLRGHNVRRARESLTGAQREQRRRDLRGMCGESASRLSVRREECALHARTPSRRGDRRFSERRSPSCRTSAPGSRQCRTCLRGRRKRMGRSACRRSLGHRPRLPDSASRSA